MDTFLVDAIPLDTDLLANYPQLVKLGDHLFQEVADLAKTTNKYRSKEALKLILINLFQGFVHGTAVRYSRDKKYYSSGSRYSQIWFKYDRVIPIIDALKDLGYAEGKDGIHYPNENVAYQSRIWATEKLIELFHRFYFPEIEYAEKPPPKELIQLKDYDGSFMDYEETHKTETMRSNLMRYNKFIEKQVVEIDLPAEVPVSWDFLKTRKGNVLSRRIDVVRISTHKDRKIEVDDLSSIVYEIDGMTFLLTNEENPAATEKIFSILKTKTKELEYSNYNQYFLNYIYYLSLQYHQQQPKDLSMTQSFFENRKNNQPVNSQMTTTVEDDLEKKPLANYGIHQLTFRLNYQYLHRVFIGGFDWGGRFYGAAHIDLPKEVRERITINGAQTAELDYSAHHVRILYNSCKIPYDKDPYQELCQDPQERPIYKKVVLVSLNAKDENEAIKAISQELRKEGYQGEFLKHDFVRDCLNKFKEIHKPISDCIHQNYGLDLQYTDSRITDEVLYQMVSKGIPTLPVHDSFLVPSECEDVLREVMIEAYKKIMGEEYLPVVKK